MNSEKYDEYKKINENLLKDVDIYSKNLKQISDVIKSFINNFNPLKESCLKLNLTNSFSIFNDIFKKLSEQLNIIVESIDNSVLQVINNIQKNLYEKVKQNSELLNKIKHEIEQEEYLRKKKIENNINDNSKFNYSTKYELMEDDKIFNQELNENNKKIYKYEIEFIRGKINKKIINFNKSYGEINDVLNNSSEIYLAFNLFSNFIKQINLVLVDFNAKIKAQIQAKEKDPDKNNGIFKVNSNIIKENDDFTLVEKAKTTTIPDIVNKIIDSKNKINLPKITKIFDSFENNINDIKKKNAKEIFLSKILDLCQNGLVLVKNEDNFIYLANILNAIFLQEKSFLIFSQIITVSKHIKYKNKYLYEIMTKKNRFFKTKTLWMKLIEQDLINKINDYIIEKLNNRNGEKEKDEINKKREKENIKTIIRNLGIEKDVSPDIKKLHAYQINDLNKYIKDCSVALLSKYIIIMNQFLLEEELIDDIIKNYRNKLELSNEVIYYLKTLTLIHDLNSKNPKVDINENNTRKYKKSLIIFEALKYIDKEDYAQFLPLNKILYPKLKKVLLNNIWKQKQNNFSLDLYIKYLGSYLQIYKIKKEYDYNIIKNVNNSYIDQCKDDKKINKIRELIKQDLKRTTFLRKNPTHNEAIESILNTFCFTFSDIGYYQGFNVIVSFFYQLLNYDEEKTFYFFYGLQHNTNYHKIFYSKMEFLNQLFFIFEKIVKLNMPEILFILKNIKINLNYFCSSWFTTLFIENVNDINREDPPLLLIYFLGKFCTNNWSAIFDLGLTILEIGYEKIIKLEKEELIKYIMTIVKEENIFDNNNFDKCKSIFEKYEKMINEDYVEKLMEIKDFEYKNKYLIDYQ